MNSRQAVTQSNTSKLKHKNKESLLDNTVRERTIEKAKGLGKLTNVMPIDRIEAPDQGKEP